MTEPSYDACLVEAELRARAAYTEPHRHYHDERHLDDCLCQFDDIRDLSEDDRRRLRWAILWHDAIYDPTRNDNEERSAELARSELIGCGVDETDADEVARLILLTKGHRVEESDRLGALLISIDLSILGSVEARYQEYVAGVRKEFAHVPDEVWRKGRSAVLRHLLDADPIYTDQNFRERLEARGRRNMETELKSLTEG